MCSLLHAVVQSTVCGIQLVRISKKGSSIGFVGKKNYGQAVAFPIGSALLGISPLLRLGASAEKPAPHRRYALLTVRRSREGQKALVLRGDAGS